MIKINYKKIFLLLIFIISSFSLSSCSTNKITHYYDVINGSKKYDYKNPVDTIALLKPFSSHLDMYNDKGYQLLKLFDDINFCNTSSFNNEKLTYSMFDGIFIEVYYRESLNVYSKIHVEFYVTESGTCYFCPNDEIIYYSNANSIDYNYVYSSIEEFDD